MEAEVDKGRLSVNPDRNLIRDVALRDQAVRTLASIDPFWLQLGLEAVTRAPVVAWDR